MSQFDDFEDDYDYVWSASDCSHIGIVSISATECQCMDCLAIWPKGAAVSS